MKKLLSLVMAVVMLFTCIPAFAEMQAPVAAEPERQNVEEARAPRSFMDGIPAYMRRK